MKIKLTAQTNMWQCPMRQCACIKILTAAFFVITAFWQMSNYPLIEDRLNKLWLPVQWNTMQLLKRMGWVYLYQNGRALTYSFKGKNKCVTVCTVLPLMKKKWEDVCKVLHTH